MGTMPLYITLFYIFLISGGFTLTVERAEKEEEHNLTFADVPELLTGLSSTGLAAFSILFNKTAEKFRSLRKEQSNLVIRNMDNRTVAEVVEEVKGTAEPSKPIKEEKDFQISTANRIEEGTVDTVTKGTGRSPISTSQKPKTEKQDIKIVVINNANAETVKQIVEGLEKSVDATGEESNEKETDIRIVIINNSHMETVSTTQPPTTEPPTTQPPTTKPSTTQPPTTKPSTTQPPTTKPPTTQPPTTEPPTSKLLTIERRVSTSVKPIKPGPKPLKCDPAFCRRLGRLGEAAVSPCDPNYCHCDTADRAWLRPCPAGRSFETKINHNCVNVPDWMNDRTTSVRTGGGCIILCEDRNCQGRCVKVSPEGGPGYCEDHSDLSSGCDFSDMTTSIKPC